MVRRRQLLIQCLLYCGTWQGSDLFISVGFAAFLIPPGRGIVSRMAALVVSFAPFPCGSFAGS